MALNIRVTFLISVVGAYLSASVPLWCDIPVLFVWKMGKMESFMACAGACAGACVPGCAGSFRLVPRSKNCVEI